MIKKYILVVLAILIAIYAGFWFGKRAAIAPQSPESVPNGMTEQATTTQATSTPKKVESQPRAVKTTSARTSSVPAMTKDGAYIVSYTDRGFVPALLEIRKGRAVHFVNNSNKAMSLTAIDQNSQVYSEFNQEKSVGRAGTFDFTFLTAGAWEYMNRNNKGDRGTITVK